ncbi:hypothetical protein RMP33_002003 [Salmonella enterica]|nr:hypothetical protein [Salmonella enterica]
MLSKNTEYLFQDKDLMKKETYRILILTPCNYLFSYLNGIIFGDKISIPVKLAHARTLKDAFYKQKKHRAKIILLAPSSSSTIEIMMARFNILKLENIMDEELIPKATCLLLNSQLKVEVSDNTYQLRKRFFEYDLTAILKLYLAIPRQLSEMSKHWQPLTEVQSEILSALLSGKSITDMAESLNISYSCIRARKKALIKKLGLRNKVLLINIEKTIFTDSPSHHDI